MPHRVLNPTSALTVADSFLVGVKVSASKTTNHTPMTRVKLFATHNDSWFAIVFVENVNAFIVLGIEVTRLTFAV
ncbi:MAG: hypothetical protein WAX04_14525 [Oscillospiraceae bacterium]